MNVDIIGSIDAAQATQLYNQFVGLTKKPLRTLYFLQIAPCALMNAILSVDVSGTKSLHCYTNGCLTFPAHARISCFSSTALPSSRQVSFPLAFYPSAVPQTPVAYNAPRAHFYRQKSVHIDYGYTSAEMFNFTYKTYKQTLYVDPGRDRLQYSRFYNYNTGISRNVCARVLKKYQISRHSNVFQIETCGCHTISGLQVKQLGINYAEEDSFDRSHMAGKHRIQSKAARKPAKQVIYILPEVAYFYDNPSHFYAVQIPYADAIAYLLIQMRFMLYLVFETKETRYLLLDDDFNIQSKYYLTTKQIKHGRIGHSLGLLLELCYLLKQFYNITAACRMGYVDANEAEGMLLSLLQSLGYRIAIYRFKYKTMRHFKGLQAMADLRINAVSPYLFVLSQIFRSLRETMRIYLLNYIMRLTGQTRRSAFKQVTKYRRERAADAYYAYISGELADYAAEAWTLWKTTFSRYCSPNLTDAQNCRINDIVAQRWQQYRLQCLEIRRRLYFSLKAMKASEIKENFNRYTVLLMARLHKLDTDLLVDLQSEATYQRYRQLFARAKAMKMASIASSELNDPEMRALALETTYRVGMAYNRSQSEQELAKLAQTDFNVYFARLLGLLGSSCSGCVEIQFYDRMQYVEVKFEDYMSFEVLDRLVLALVMRRFPMLFDPAISLSADASWAQFDRTRRQLAALFPAYVLQITEREYGITFDVPIRLLDRILGLFLDDSLRNYVTARFSSVFVNGPRRIRPQMFIFSAFPLAALAIQLIRFLSIPTSESDDSAAFELFRENRAWKKCYYSVLHTFHTADDFLQELPPQQHTSKPDDCQLDELLFATSHHRERIRCFGAAASSGNYLQQRLADALGGSERVVCFCVGYIELLYYRAKLDYYQPTSTPDARMQLQSHFQALNLHAYSQFTAVADRFNKIALCYLSYFHGTSMEDTGICAIAQHRLIKLIQRRVHTRDTRRYCNEIFIISYRNGGLGIFNFDAQFPMFSSYILPPDAAQLTENSVKQLRQHAEPYLPLLENTLKPSQNAAIDAYYDDVFEATCTVKLVERASLFRFSQQDYENTSKVTKNFVSYAEEQQFGQMTKAQRTGANMIANRRFLAFWSPLINRTYVFIGKRQRIAQTGISVHGKLLTLCQFYQQVFKLNLWAKIHANVVAFLRKELARIQGISSVQPQEAHLDKIYGLVDAPSNYNGYCADLLCTSTNELSFGTSFVLDAYLVFLSADEFSESQLNALLAKLARKHKLAAIWLFVDVVFCRIRCLSHPQLKQIADELICRLRSYINHFPAVRLLRRRARQLLQISSQVAEYELFLTYDNVSDLVQDGNFYIDTVQTRSGRTIICVSFAFGSVDFLCAQTEAEAVQNVVALVCQRDAENVQLITEDAQLRVKMYDAVALFAEREIDCVYSLLQLKLKTLAQFGDMPTSSGKTTHARIYGGDVKKYGQRATYFWRTVAFLNCADVDRQAATRIVSACREMRQIDFFARFSSGSGVLTLSDADQRMQALLMRTFACERKDLRSLMLGAEIERTKQAVFSKNGNQIISGMLTSTDARTATYPQRILALEPSNCTKAPVLVIPNVLREFWDLQNQGFHICGITIEGVREIRCLIRNFAGGFGLESFGVFGTELRISPNGELHAYSAIVVTQKFGLAVLVQRALLLYPWDFLFE